MARFSKTADPRSRNNADNRFERARSAEIESMNSPRIRNVNDNASQVFGAFVFVAAFLVTACAGYAVTHAVNIWVLCIAFAVSVLAVSTIRIASQWERVIILRFGTFSRTAGPGIFFTIPFVDHIALRADQRIMLSCFSAEETLTSDLVPVNVDAAVFWMVWDAEKACLEVENYYDAVSMAAQTALRDAIGRKSISDITVHRDKLDQELRDKIEEKSSTWGVSIMSVEIRDIVIPKNLQEDMAASARAEREKDARVVLAEVEQDIASMLDDATAVYQNNELAFKLRQMHLVSDTLRDAQGSVVVPSSYVEGFTGSGNGQNKQ